jgi:hypothetical protein
MHNSNGDSSCLCTSSLRHRCSRIRQWQQQMPLTNLCLAMSIFPSNTSDTTATSKLAPHLHKNNIICSSQRYGHRLAHAPH